MAEAYFLDLEDEHGNVVDRAFYCAFHVPAEIYPWPGFDWPAYDVHCHVCNALIHEGDDDDDA